MNKIPLFRPESLKHANGKTVIKHPSYLPWLTLLVYALLSVALLTIAFILRTHPHV